MKKNNYKRILTILFLVSSFFILTTLTTAWGVAPARQYAKNTLSEQSLLVNLVNTDLENGFFKISFSGTLAPYAKTNSPTIYVLSDQSHVEIPFSLQVPSTLDPGKNTLAIVLEQTATGGDTTIGATVTLIAEVIVNKPIEGEFVTADVIVQTVSEEKAVPITISVFNTGTKDVPVWADVHIKGPTNQPITSFTTEKTIVSVGSTTKIETFWDEQKYQGTYIAEVIIHYGENFKTIIKGFSVKGDKVISEYISSDKFRLGDIVPVDIGVKNNWNTLIEGVYAEVFVLRQDGGIVQTFKTGPEDILAKESGVLSTYWDTTKLVVGDYDLNVILHFSGETSQRIYKASVSMDELDVMLPTGHVTSGKGNSSSSDSVSSMLVILIIIVLIVNVLGFFYMRKYFASKKSD